MSILTDQHRKTCGRVGEEIAKQFLVDRYYDIMATNFHSRYGEIDIVAIKNGITYFCEVKARTTLTFGTPEEAVNWKKLHKIKKTIQCYIDEHGYTPWQIDIIAIYLSPKLKPLKITHYKNIPSS